MSCSAATFSFSRSLQSSTLARLKKAFYPYHEAIGIGGLQGCDDPTWPHWSLGELSHHC